MSAFAAFHLFWNLFFTMSYLAVLYIISEGSLAPVTQSSAGGQQDQTKGAYTAVQGTTQQPFENINTAYNSPLQQQNQQQHPPQLELNYMQTPPPMSQPGFEPTRNEVIQPPAPLQQYYDPVKGEDRQSLLQNPVHEQQPAPQYQAYDQPSVPQPYR
ncbi:hypothetical protein FQN49_008137 [Arthroderma sp. PD_2]|nr:hypothetical protein FQN49_008137 [Arthroderma sp. PD_2]